MRIKVFFYLLVLFLILLGVLIAWLTWEGSGLGIYLMEGFILFILIYLGVFYGKLVKPLNTIANGMDLLREQDFSSRLSPVKQHEADRIVYIFNRMMEQLKNERLHLREQNHFLDLLIQASPMGVVIMTFDDRVSQANPMAARMLGLSPQQMLNKRVAELDTPLAQEMAALEREETREVRLNDANIYKCTYSYFIDRGAKHPFYLLERMTEEVMHAEKKAYEKVIRMIAHEVNNTTAGITSTLDTIGQALADEPAADDIREVTRVCIERCYSMSRFITRFADVVKIPAPVLQTLSLNDTVTSCTRFMEGMCADRSIRLTLRCDPAVQTVRLDAALFEQVLVNIIKNAAESIGTDGDITVSTIAPATVEVTDNGPGISRDTEAKLFTPFFSTKPHGQGIGLVFIREVLSRHGCTFSLRTYADGLTRFRITF